MPTGETDWGEERRARPLHGLSGSGVGETDLGERRWTRRKVGRRVRAQTPAGKNDHGDSEEVDKVQDRRAQVQAPALRRESQRSEAGCTHPVYVCKRAGPDCIVLCKFTTPGSYYSNMWRHSL